MSWPVTFVHADFLVLRCVRIKDRRTVFQFDALTPVASLPDSCTLLGNRGQMHRPCSSNIWSCPLFLPSVHTVKHLGHDYGFAWVLETNGESVRGISWVGLTRGDLHRFEKHCFNNKRWQLFSYRFRRIFRVCPPNPVFHVPCTVCRRFGFRALHQCQRTVFLQSDTGGLVWAISCRKLSVPAVSNCTCEGRHHTSHLGSARALQVVHDSCSLWVTQQKELILCTIDDSRGDTQHDIFTERDTFPYNFVFFTFFGH